MEHLLPCSPGSPLQDMQLSPLRSDLSHSMNCIASGHSADDELSSSDDESSDYPSISASEIGSPVNHFHGHSACSSSMVHQANPPSRMVPFKWEEVPGRPLRTSSCNGLAACRASSLQLPPKLHCVGGSATLQHFLRWKSPSLRSPLFIKRNTIHPPMSCSLFRPSPNRQIVQKLCKYMLKTSAFTSHSPLHRLVSHTWKSPSCMHMRSTSFHEHHEQEHEDKIVFNDRFFFDKNSPKDLRHCASMDSMLPVFDPSDEEDELMIKATRNSVDIQQTKVSEPAVSRISSASSSGDQSMSFQGSSCSTSTWKPSSSHVTEYTAAPWTCVPTNRICNMKKAYKEDVDKGFHDYLSPWHPKSLRAMECTSPPWPRLSDKVRRQLEKDHDDEDDGLHDFFSTTSSAKPSHRTEDDNSMDSTCSSPAPWYLNFGPENEEIHVKGRGNKLEVTLVALIKLRKAISKKVINRFRKRGQGANHHLENNMWSPTLATYLYNQQEEERHMSKGDQGGHDTQSICPSIESPRSPEDEKRSEFGSNRLHINPNYYLPKTIKSHSMNPHRRMFPEDESHSDFGSNRLHTESYRNFPEAIKSHSLNGVTQRRGKIQGQERSYLNETDTKSSETPVSSPFLSFRKRMTGRHEPTNFERPASSIAGPPSSSKLVTMGKVRKTVQDLVSKANTVPLFIHS
ncbi:hypothetical protein KP509_13G071200 [Ceratopteris richardii]|uniref:Uncharacterized protein n=3 Tax=Ceratopteris richardii TaxID=49495 RepID=A0A8T2TGR5_CERRI|nr:hypothetical protein KP509_13G071200 [Ceratopteris richardii]